MNASSQDRGCTQDVRCSMSRYTWPRTRKRLTARPCEQGRRRTEARRQSDRTCGTICYSAATTKLMLRNRT